MNEITFREEDHSYWAGGRRIPNVTSLMEPLFGYDWVNQEVLERKANLGSAVHYLTECFDRGEDMSQLEMHPATVPYFEAYQRFMAEVKPEWNGIEEIVYHKTLGYAGKLDRRGDINGSPSILDIKCVAQVSMGAFVQCSAYSAAYMPVGELDRYILQLKPDGKYQLYTPKAPHREDFAVFTACLSIFRWKAKYAN